MWEEMNAVWWTLKFEITGTSAVIALADESVNKSDVNYQSTSKTLQTLSATESNLIL